MQLRPATDWSLVWGSLHNVILPDEARSAWYTVIHDIILTNGRMHRIRLMNTENCIQCGRQDTILHRLTECGVRQEICEWTPHMDSSDTKDRPETYTQGMAPSFLFRTTAPTKTSGDLVVFGMFLCGESMQDLISTGLY
jgi:hypothetical protein